MKKSEKILAGATAAVLVGYTAFLAIGGEEGGVSVDGSTLEVQRDRFREMAEQVANAENIYREYFRLVGSQSASNPLDDPASTGRPDLDFQRLVAGLSERSGFPRPNISTTTQEIRDVTDYVMVLVTVDIREGDLPRLAQLMKVFEQNGLIITEAELRGTRDRPDMSARITVGRLAPDFGGVRRRR